MLKVEHATSIRGTIRFLRESGQLTEVSFETAGDDQLEDQSSLGTGVPKGMRNATRLPDDIARTGSDDLLANLRLNCSVNDIAQFVLPRMRVDREA